ncbi:hypothetical protein FXO37_23427 [Capsicum annuum]|nr:hypothetical protein FXO37_23427 [Capsicum annuum]
MQTNDLELKGLPKEKDNQRGNRDKPKFIDLINPATLNKILNDKHSPSLSITIKPLTYNDRIPRVTWMEENVDTMNMMKQLQYKTMGKFSYDLPDIEGIYAHVSKQCNIKVEVGKSIHLDMTTINKTKPSCTKVNVLVSLADKLPEEVEIKGAGADRSLRMEKVLQVSSQDFGFQAPTLSTYAVGGQAIKMAYDKLYTLLNHIVQGNLEWHGDSRSATKKVAGYVKVHSVLEGCVANKVKLKDVQAVALTEECGFVVSQKMPKKIKDTGKFTISGIYYCSGARVSEPMLTNGTIAHPEGVIEDVLIKVDVKSEYRKLELRSMEKIECGVYEPF